MNDEQFNDIINTIGTTTAVILCLCASTFAVRATYDFVTRPRVEPKCSYSVILPPLKETTTSE